VLVTASAAAAAPAHLSFSIVLAGLPLAAAQNASGALLGAVGKAVAAILSVKASDVTVSFAAALPGMRRLQPAGAAGNASTTIVGAVAAPAAMLPTLAASLTEALAPGSNATAGLSNQAAAAAGLPAGSVSATLAAVAVVAAVAPSPSVVGAPMPPAAAQSSRTAVAAGAGGGAAAVLLIVVVAVYVVRRRRLQPPPVALALAHKRGAATASVDVSHQNPLVLRRPQLVGRGRRTQAALHDTLPLTSEARAAAVRAQRAPTAAAGRERVAISTLLPRPAPPTGGLLAAAMAAEAATVTEALEERAEGTRRGRSGAEAADARAQRFASMPVATV